MSKDLFVNYSTMERNGETITDLTVRLDFIARLKNNISLFQYYQLSDYERPEDVALMQYGDARLYWIVLMFNDICDPFYDWLLSEEDLRKYVSKKYGPENVYGVHHYETIDGSNLDIGTWVNQGTPFSKSVSNYDYEDFLNENKRKIKIINRQYIGQILSEYTKELSNHVR